MQPNCYSIDVTREEIQKIMVLMDSTHRFSDPTLADLGIENLVFPLNKDFSKKLILKVK